MAETPMMRQYREAKQACPDALLLFRMGDFYELFFEDAKTAAQLLHLSLTSRDKGENPVPMAGFPHHQLESYLAKIVKAGKKAAICDQVEDPKLAKGIVRREVTRVVTAGTLTDDALLDPRASNYLAAVCLNGRRRDPKAGIAWVELSTGQFQAAEVSLAALADELARISPSECLCPEESAIAVPMLESSFAVTRLPEWVFSHSTAHKTLTEHFGASSLQGFGFEDDEHLPIRAAGAVIYYLCDTQKSSLGHIDRITPYRENGSLRIDHSTRRSLELVRSIRAGTREGTLLSVMDQTVTAMGARLLEEWLRNPSTDLEQINTRLDAIEDVSAHPPLIDALRELLRDVYDLERLISRVSTGRASPRDLQFVGRTLARLPAIKAKLAGRKSRLLAEQDEQIDLCAEVRAELERSLTDNCPLSVRDGGVIKQGYNLQLDELRELSSGGKQWIARYQSEQVKTSGIPSLKVGYNKVFGYYLEVTHAQREKVPLHYIRKQTLKNAERYITPELKEHEEKVLAAEEKQIALEIELFTAIRGRVQACAGRILRSARALACVDVIVTLADLARKRNYCRPVLNGETGISISAGRHPVLDVVLPPGEFVANDCNLSDTDARLVLLTGPNMAGKSTYIRQIALITVMAQMGSFVPAASAEIGMADQLFARVGASDELARGQSTFMVEMTETARILNNSTSRSLVILDEIGRGTSTFDGLSLAWAVAEYLHNSIGCRTLFATHYHELTRLEHLLESVRNFNAAVQETDQQIVFLHRIEPGPAAGSYGIHVARMAGVPRQVTQRAAKLLARLEAKQIEPTTSPIRSGTLGKENGRPRASVEQLPLFEPPG